MQILVVILAYFTVLSGSLTDKRQGAQNIFYSLPDIFLGAFSLFFSQSPSFLAFQRKLEKGHTKTNCQTLFGMKRIPSDNYIRSMLDEVSPTELQPFFDKSLETLRDNGGLSGFTVLGKRTLIALDGTEYFNSQKLRCGSCQHRELANGRTEHYHSMLCATIVAPQHNHVFPLMPEFITPQDGHDKQDCELAAAKRWLGTHHQRVEFLRPIYLGDALFACQPLCQAIRETGADFVFCCKPSKNKGLYELVDGMQREKLTIRTQRPGHRCDTTVYEWITDIPLRKGDDAERVNWIRITTTTQVGKVIYHNDFIASLPVTKKTVADLALCGRARWKIENGNFNEMKNNGYEIEHNFGHGKKNLAMVFAAMNLLAFALHTIMDCCSEVWKRVRKYERTRKDFFQAMSHACRYIIFPSWESLWDTMLDKGKTPMQNDFKKECSYS
jgi:hypothetical protein